MTPESEFNLQHYLQVAWRRKWWILVPFLLSAVGSPMLVHYLPKTYRSSTLILVEPQKVPENYVKPTISGSIEDRLTTIRQQLQSRSLLQKIVEEFGLYPKEAKEMGTEAVIDLLRKNIEVKTVGNDKTIDAFTISYEGQEPIVTMNVTNKLTSLFIEENLKIREQLVEGASDFLDSELKIVTESLNKQETEISEYKKKNMGELPQQLEANLRTLDRYQMELQTITAQLKIAEDRKSNLERTLSEGDRARMSTAEDDPLSAGPVQSTEFARTKLESLKQDLVRLRSEYKDTYPDIIALKSQIEDLEKRALEEASPESGKPAPAKPNRESMLSPQEAQLYRDVQRQLQETLIETRSLRDRQKVVLKQIDLYQRRVENTPEREQQLMTLLRDYENTKKNYQELLDKKLNAQISENLEKRQKGEQFRILDPANLPQKPFKPDVNRVLAMGLASGLGAGVGLAILLELMDTSFRKPEEIEEALGLPVLVSVPRFNRKRFRVEVLDRPESTDVPSRTLSA